VVHRLLHRSASNLGGATCKAAGERPRLHTEDHCREVSISDSDHQVTTDIHMFGPSVTGQKVDMGTESS